MLAVIGLVGLMAIEARAQTAATLSTGTRSTGTRSTGTPSTGTPDVGATIAQKGNAPGAAPCTTCHGVRGEGNAAIGAPRLAGLGASYIVEQLDAFADKQRENAIMLPIAQALPVAERAAVAAHFSRLPPPEAGVPGTAGGNLGAKLALRGRWSEKLPGCEQCHGPEGMGVGAVFPPLAGLPAHYIEAQLRAWKIAARPPGPLGLMAAVAGRLSNDDITAVAAYFASIGVAPQTGGIKAGAIKSGVVRGTTP
ncbi:c-type cytochrome [Rhodopila sp.]|uniref:c-type cytochrome n=1 Tax=Rhodopila sp. TaxID=2480087 RepID=UPI003D0F41D9